MEKGETEVLAQSSTELPLQPGLEDSVTKTVQDVVKTKLCRHFLRGMCWRGDTCMFAHGKEELRQEYKLHKTTMCRYYQNGTCLYGSKCRYAHKPSELLKRPEWALRNIKEEEGGDIDDKLPTLCILCANDAIGTMVLLDCGHSLHRECFVNAGVHEWLRCPLCSAPVTEARFKTYGGPSTTPPVLVMQQPSMHMAPPVMQAMHQAPVGYPQPIPHPHAHYAVPMQQYPPQMQQQMHPSHHQHQQHHLHQQQQQHARTVTAPTPHGQQGGSSQQPSQQQQAQQVQQHQQHREQQQQQQQQREQSQSQQQREQVVQQQQQQQAGSLNEQRGYSLF